MYRISQLAEQLGLSRTTLLYYEKQGLISGKRLDNGYRSYSEKDIQRLKLLQKLQAGGLTLKECQACLDSKIDREVLSERLRQLDTEIEKKKKSRALLAALLGESSLTEWHESLEQAAPDAHLDWLIKQGFDEKQAMRLKWLSKDINDHEQYMNDFNLIFSELECWGPGSEADTLKALQMVPNNPQSILEIGCGQGSATQVLTAHISTKITAVDNEESALRFLENKLDGLGLSGNLDTVCADMHKLPFEPDSFDLIWCEGSAYIMGVSKALKTWRPLLKEDGVLVFSDAVWSTDTPSEEALNFWQKEYPDITSVDARLKQAEEAGFELVDMFTLDRSSWLNYYSPLENRVKELESELVGSRALSEIKRELEIFQKYADEFDYQMFVLKLSN
ncbi:MerR family transcriptional regulator [Vibrio sp. HN007]|uniref:MerR family transcriptional regulator n=1 Tax=Vibrio iocasae TaxID=3098914 RepID=UPI0035D483CB